MIAGSGDDGIGEDGTGDTREFDKSIGVEANCSGFMFGKSERRRCGDDSVEINEGEGGGDVFDVEATGGGGSGEEGGGVDDLSAVRVGRVADGGGGDGFDRNGATNDNVSICESERDRPRVRRRERGLTSGVMEGDSVIGEVVRLSIAGSTPACAGDDSMEAGSEMTAAAWAGIVC